MADPLVFQDDEPLTAELLNRAFRSLDLRQRAAEGVVIDWQAAVEELRSFGLLRLNSAIEPVYRRLTAISQLGVAFTASSASMAVLGTGIRTFQLSAADRDRFAAAAYLAARQVGDPEVALSGALQSYDRTTGTLVIAVDQFSGTLGEVAGPWMISPAASADLGGYTKGEVDELLDERQLLSPNLNALAAGSHTAFGRSLLGILDEDQLVLLLGLTRFDVGLGSVNNTADLDKPVSTAVGAAIADAIAEARVVSDARYPLVSGLTGSNANSGYRRLPGGITLQWGRVPNTNGDTSVGFPAAFSAVPFSIVGTTEWSGATQTAYVFETNMGEATPTSFNARTRLMSNGGTVAPVGLGASWIAIGPT